MCVCVVVVVLGSGDAACPCCYKVFVNGTHKECVVCAHVCAVLCCARGKSVLPVCLLAAFDCCCCCCCCVPSLKKSKGNAAVVGRKKNVLGKEAARAPRATQEERSLLQCSGYSWPLD
jgi:hypothetical protein